MRRLPFAVRMGTSAILVTCALLSQAQQTVHPLPQAVPGTSYAAQLAIPPGLGYPFAKCELSGPAPRWLTLDCGRLQLKGKVPTASAKDSQVEVTLRLEDTAGNSREFPLSLRVSTSPQVVSLAEPEAAAPQVLDRSSSAVSALHPEQPSSPMTMSRRNESDDMPGYISTVTVSPPLIVPGVGTVSPSNDSASAEALSAATIPMRRASNRTSSRRVALVNAPKSVPGNLAANGDPNSQPACPSVDMPQACAALTNFREAPSFDCSNKKYAEKDQKNAEKDKCEASIAKYQALIDAVNSDSAALQKKIANLPSTTTLDMKNAMQTEAQDWSDLACDLENNKEAFKVGNYRVPATDPPTSNLSGCYKSSPYFRGLLGGVYSAASSTDPQFKLLADLTVDLPIGGDKKKNGIPNSQSIWLWGYTRVGSLSQQTSVIDPSQISADYAKLANAQPSQIVQSFEMNVGIAYQMKAWQGNLTYFDHGSFSLIAGGGALTPLSPSQITSQTFSGLQTSLVKLYPALTPTNSSCDSAKVGPNQLCYVSYYPQDRSRFYSGYEAGLRVKLYPSPEYLKASPFPAIFDITVGQNEYVTGGGFDGVVLHVGGSSPISAISGLYAFGGMDIGINNRADQPINAVLTPFTGTLPTTVPVALKIIQPPPNRDRYALGFGLDILQLLRTHQLQDAFNKK